MQCRERKLRFLCAQAGASARPTSRWGGEFCRETSCRGEGRQQADCRAGQTPSSGNLKVQTV